MKSSRIQKYNYANFKSEQLDSVTNLTELRKKKENKDWFQKCPVRDMKRKKNEVRKEGAEPQEIQ